jgi:hypothetical protein
MRNTEPGAKSRNLERFPRRLGTQAMIDCRSS